MNDEIRIPLSKKKITLILLGSIAFVFGGIWMVLESGDAGYYFNAALGRFIYLTPELIQIIGVVGILFFGAAGVYGIRKLFDNNAGLIIDSNGITDNSNAFRVGLVKWSDIIGIEILKVHSQKFIRIEVSNPEHYINLKKNGIGKMAMRANYNKFGSPISISANSLRINFEELQEIIEKRYEKNVLQIRTEL